MSWDRRTQYNLLNSINRKLPKVDFSNLLIDTREKKTKPVKFLLSKGINLKFQKLPVGDYYFPSEEILIERKVVSDLHKSLEQWRLYKQTDFLAQSWKRVMILIEWELWYWKIHPNWILWAQLSLCFRYQIPILRSENYLETINILLLILEKIKKWWYEKSKMYYQHSVNAKYIDDPQMKILMSLPDCWPKVAESILKKFWSVKSFFNAKDKEILSIPWIWSKKLEKWRKVIDWR